MKRERSERIYVDGQSRTMLMFTKKLYPLHIQPTKQKEGKKDLLHIDYCINGPLLATPFYLSKFNY